jgi:cation:H+ antiporter
VDAIQFQDILRLLAGVVGTWIGAELLVRGSARLAISLGLRPLLVGLTVVAFGTSSPEAVVSYVAEARGSVGIAVGNVLGSNIANIGLILGLVSLIHPMRVTWSEIRRDVAFMVLATFVAAGALLGGYLNAFAGAVLWMLLVVSIFLSVRRPPNQTFTEPMPEVERSPSVLGRAVVQTVLGLILLVVSARLMVDAAQAVATALGVEETIIGATVVAVGTSIPELAASLVAVARRHYDIGIGNIVGSNLMNLTFVLGTVPFIRAVRNSAADAMAGTNWSVIAVMLAFTLAFVPMLMTGGRVRRREGAVLLAGYVAFSWYVYF